MREAIKSGDASLVVALVRSDAEHVTITTVFGTWLHVAARYGNVNVSNGLIDCGLNVNARGGILGGTPINVAASAGHIEMVRSLLSRGATLDTEKPEWNPLFAAIYGGHIDIVKLLMEVGVDPRIRYTTETRSNVDALAFARERGQSDIAAYLEGA